MKKYYCIDCKKEVSNKHTKRCQNCMGLYYSKKLKGKNNPFYGKKHTNLTKKKISITHKGLNNYSYIDGRTLQNRFCKDCGKKVTYKALRCYKCANKKELNPQFGKHHTKKSLLKISNSNKNNWKNSIYRNKVLKLSRLGMKLRPNHPEKLLIKLLPKSFKYVGNKNLWIERYNPDFINKKTKSIIELFGTYWHNLDSYKKRDKRKLRIYKKYGYKVLIIWQHELRDINKVINKIKRFVNASI